MKDQRILNGRIVTLSLRDHSIMARLMPCEIVDCRKPTAEGSSAGPRGQEVGERGKIVSVWKL